MGRTWTVLIVAQVAVAVAALPVAVFLLVPSITRGLATPDYPVDEVLRASVSLTDSGVRPQDESNDADRTRFAGYLAELRLQLESQPEVQELTWSRWFPGEERVARVEIEGRDGAVGAWVNDIGPDFFTTFDVSVTRGRDFELLDAASGENPVIVDQAFAEELLGGGSVLGRRFRLIDQVDEGPEGESPSGWK